MQDKIESVISDQFSSHVKAVIRRPGIFQLLLPLYYEDGDMMDIYLVKQEDGKSFRICDFGMGIMRLSYEYEIDTPTKEEVFQRILSENSLKEEDGNIYIDSSSELLYPSIMQFAQGLAKVSSMRYFKKEVVKSLFYEHLESYILSELGSFKPQKGVAPLEGNSDSRADWAFYPNGTPVYLFGVNSKEKAKEAYISCLEYERENLAFASVAVHENFDSLAKRERNRLTNICDKQFTTLKEFQSGAIKFFQRRSA